MGETDFSYDNRTGRGPGRVVRSVSAVLPGVARVWSQVEPYADAWRARNLDALGRTGRRWFVLGDSLSQSIGASSYDAGWVDRLGARLAEDLVVVNLSATGACVTDVLDQQLPAMLALGVAEADLVSVMVGSNDLFGGPARRRALPRGLASLLAGLPRGAVVTTLPQPRRAATAANRHIERAAAEGRVAMVDLRVSGPRSWRGKLAADYFHPNDAGYDAIATALEPTVRSVLAARR